MNYEAEIKYYTEKALEVFKKYEIDGVFSYKGTKRNVEAWYNNKTPLMDILRKHPYWNEEAKAVIFLTTQTRIANVSEATRKLNALLYEIISSVDTSYKYTDLIDYIMEHLSLTVQQDWIDAANRLGITTKMRVGQKATRAINSLFRNLHTGDGSIVDVTSQGSCVFDTYNRMFAEFSDSLSSHEIKRITILSVNFIDYLLMSNGNSWATCQYINSKGLFKPKGASHYSGCSKAGTLSYANDPSTMVFYTLPEAYTGNDWCNEFKVTRQTFYYNKGLLLQSRLYPNCSETDISESYRKTVQEIMATCDNLPNLWVLSKNVNTICDVVDTHSDALHYEDYKNEDFNPTLSINKDITNDKGGYDCISIGESAYCVDCGNFLSETEHLQCSCRDNYPCDVCGSVHNVNDMLWGDGGQKYCRDCAFYCDYHYRVEVGEPYRYDRLYGNFCAEAIELMSDTCSVCGKKEINKFMRLTGTGELCCAECAANFVECSLCGELNSKDDCCHTSDVPFCNKCATKHATTLGELTETTKDTDSLEWIFRYKTTYKNGVMSFVIANMPEYLRGTGNIQRIDNYLFASYVHPQICPETIYLRGNEVTQDGKVCTRSMTLLNYALFCSALKKFQKYVQEEYEKRMKAEDLKWA